MTLDELIEKLEALPRSFRDTEVLILSNSSNTLSDDDYQKIASVEAEADGITIFVEA